MSLKLSCEDYTIGWVCALPVELAAAKAMLDEEHHNVHTGIDNENLYCMGSIAGHNVVIGCLPAGHIGNNTAATVAAQMLATFKGIKLGLMVGIGGGVPSTDTDIRLGDVVVSQPQQNFGGVVQYDFGKTTPSGFGRTGLLNSPPQKLLSAVSSVRANEELGRSTLSQYLSELERFPRFQRAKTGPDILFEAAYEHNHGGNTCDQCSTVRRQVRPQRESGAEVVVHYGTIASGNRVIKNAIERDRISADLGGVLCFEMEAAGLMNSFPCLVIRGICDYADSHKNKRWQPYASGTAAAYAKEVLSLISTTDVISTRLAGAAIGIGNKRRFQYPSPERAFSKFRRLDAPIPTEHGSAVVSVPHRGRSQTSLSEEQRRIFIDSLRFEQIDARQTTIKQAHIKTCKWLLKNEQYLDWLDVTKLDEHHGFLWIKGKAGTGKSTLMKFAWTNARKVMKDRTVISFFFNARGDDIEKSTIGTYRSLLLQLLESLPELQSVFGSLGLARSNSVADPQWHVESLKTLLQQVVLKLGNTSVVCFIDALDECEEEHVRDMVRFFENLGDLAVEEGIRFQFCFSSRHYPYITIRNGLELILEGQEGHVQDITNYIETELKIGKSKTAQQIRLELQEKASGIFMWVVLVVGILNKESDRGRIHTLRQKLREIPSDLHALFRDILTRDSHDQEAASARGHKDVDVQSVDYGNALQADSANGDRESMRLLLEKGVDTNVLQVAAKHSDGQVVNPQVGTHSDSGYASMPNKTIEYAAAQQTDFDDVETVISDSSVDESTTEKYVTEIANDLLKQTSFDLSDSQTLKRVYEILPDQLKALALKIGHDAGDERHRKIMVFIYRYRSNIVECLKGLLSNTQTNSAAHFNRDSFTQEWILHQGDDWDGITADAQDEDNIFDTDVREEAAEMHEVYMYRDLVFKGSAYQWLLASIERECSSTHANPNLMENIRQDIIRHLPTSHSVSSRRSAEAYKVSFHIQWDPLAFVQEQGYTGDPRYVLETAITLTGSTGDAQALTCIRYLLQTWPSTGQHIMQLVKAVIFDGYDQQHTCDLPDNTKLTAWMSGRNLVVEATGTAHSVAEIGEQFAWIGAALRSSPFELGVTHSIPRLDQFITHQVSNEKSGTNVKAHVGVHIKFTLQKDEEQSANARCQCWHDMFRNPVIVQGYPIPRRSEPNTGLELPLNMMAGLVHTQRASIFDGKLYIKGHTSMLVPTRRTGDLLLWHFLQHGNGEPVLYRHNRGVHANNVDFSHLDEMRHIVGWCLQAKTIAGAPEAEYLVDDSKLPGPSAECALMDAVIHKQRRITDGHPISFGSKDGHRESRVDKLEYITGKYVILWDEDDKRGWMMNGATALLHILRASLERNRTGKFRSKCSFKPEQMQEAETRYESDSALEVLLNHENQSLSIFEGEDFTVKDRIEDFVYILDQMTEYEETRLIKKSRAIGPKNQASERLEGWDFIDVATRKYPVCPRSGVLQTIGRSWTELTRSLNAITIFGRGFGDLIQPVDSCNLCSHWDRLPKNRYYLAALIPDVMQIFKDVQPRLTSPRMLFDDILWHHSDRTVDLCACLKDSSIKHFDIVDILKPHNTGQGSEGMYWIDSKESGAVLFGNCTESTTSPACQASQNQSCRQDIGLGVSGAQATIRSVDPIPSHSSLKKRQSLQAVEVHLPEPIAEANDILNNDSPKMSPPDQPKHYSEFQIAILCALKIESDAVQSFFDGHWDHHKQPQGDDNAYSTGWIGNHAVILVHLPGMGTLKASTAAKDLKRTCPHIKLGLVVGICGAVPFYGKDRKEILLGDVIVSTSLIQHDLGRQHETEFTRKRKRHEELSRSTDPIQAFLNKISTLVGHNRLSSRTTNYVVEPFRGPNASRFQYPQYPGVESDKLYETDYCHKHHNPADCRRGKCVVGEATETRFCKRASKRSCAKLGCDDRRLVPRQRLQEAKQYARQNIRLEHPTHTSSETWIHFGQIASGDAVIKSGRHRDERASAERKAGGREILGFEMEGAGVWESVPTIVVKGVCDYSDSHKNDVWHGYAASTAAACMKALLNEWPVFDRGSDDEPSKLIRY